MIKDHFDRIFILNIPRSIKRRALALFQASILGLSNIEIISGVDGQTLDLDMMRSQGILRWDEHNQRDMTSGEVGCYLSHVNVWKTLSERGLRTALICEDDLVWRLDANEIIDAFMAEVPDDWDILHFHSSFPIGSGRRSDAGRKQISNHVWQGYDESCGSGVCYALTARGARFLLDIAFPIRSTADGVTNWLTGWWKQCKGYKGYVCWPFPCQPGIVSSDIDAITSRR